MGHIMQGYAGTVSIDEVRMRGGILDGFVDAELEMCRENVQQYFGSSPQLHMAYLHVRTIVDRLLGDNNTHFSQIVHGAFQIVTNLQQQKGIFCTPWAHHYTALVTLTLMKTADLQLHDSALTALNDLRNGLDTSLFRTRKEMTAWDMAISMAITKHLDGGPQAVGFHGAGDRGGLGQLADAAMGKTGAPDGTGAITAPRARGPSPAMIEMVLNGYLKSF